MSVLASSEGIESAPVSISRGRRFFYFAINRFRREQRFLRFVPRPPLSATPWGDSKPGSLQYIPGGSPTSRWLRREALRKRGNGWRGRPTMSP